MVKEQIRELLNLLGFKQEGDKYTKEYKTTLHPLIVDVEKECIYYANSGITVTRNTTSNLSEDENLVVLECVDRLLSIGYHANHIELEPHWKMGHGQKGGFADIWVRSYSDKPFEGNEDDQMSWIIIECKTAGAKYNEAWNDTLDDGAQLFSYFQQEPKTKFLCLYTSDIVDGKVKAEYKLMNVQDNEDLLASDKSAQSYKDKNDKQRYRVWRDTYDCEYATRGLFEKDIQPYEIGKNKYTISDLTEVDNSEIQKKYHEFALILRQHNVSGRENAFDKLVNLFLAKVVDETNNPEDLHFYWKGTAYDDDFQLQDRLQRLYRDGMMRFLKEEVTYIENSEIDKAFRRFKNDPDSTKKTIMEYFRALKFFSDNDFSFISVHNEKLFRQNAVVLRKMVKMLQDIRLKTNEAHQNQFLGDLFEGFLNRGIKQSEGQFFTPMPIVRFIVSSLPLEHVIRDNEDIPWAIDYACGAGHFLTEYAVRIKEFVENGMFDIYSANVYEPFGTTNHSILSDFSLPSVLWGIDGDWMVNFIDKNAKFCPTDHCGVIRVLNESIVLPYYLVYPLQKEGERLRFSRANRASTERIRSLSLQVPSLGIQKEVVEKLRKYDSEIANAKQQISSAPSRKQAILDKYLK